MRQLLSLNACAGGLLGGPVERKARPESGVGGAGGGKRRASEVGCGSDVRTASIRLTTTIMFARAALRTPTQAVRVPAAARLFSQTASANSKVAVLGASGGIGQPVCSFIYIVVVVVILRRRRRAICRMLTDTSYSSRFSSSLTRMSRTSVCMTSVLLLVWLLTLGTSTRRASALVTRRRTLNRRSKVPRSSSSLLVCHVSRV